jgi:hypothetical protein
VASTTARTDTFSVTWVAVVGVTLLIGVNGCDWLFAEPTKVLVRNATETDLHDLRLSVVGDEVVIGEVPQAQMRTAKVRPKGDSGLVLSFSHGSPARACQQKPDVYLDRMMGGNIEIDVLSCEVSSTKNMPGARATVNKK